MRRKECWEIQEYGEQREGKEDAGVEEVEVRVLLMQVEDEGFLFCRRFRMLAQEP